ncbi:MAG: hypothetical protein ACI4UC_09805 [Alloprevotella sp.]
MNGFRLQLFTSPSPAKSLDCADKDEHQMLDGRNDRAVKGW